jgi:SulP family sulfate permease
MANAVLASVNPVAGLYTLMVAMPVGAVFTGSVFMNVSTTGALSVAAGEALAGVAEDARLRALVLLVLMIGVVQLVFGLLRFGRLIRFVSHAVMTGFITGIAVLIVLGSVPDLTGYRSPQGTHLLRMADTVLSWRILDPATLSVGSATVLLILAFQKTPLRKFALILALAFTTLLALLLAAAGAGDALVLVGDVAEIPRNLPAPMMPDAALLQELLLPAVAIAIIGLVQGAGVGQSYPNPDGAFPDTSRDFVGQGAANIAGSVFGAIPAGGSMSGTAVTVQAGAQSRWANIFGGLFIIVIIFLLVDVVKLVPMAALGGLLLVVGLQNIQPAEVRLIWQTGMAARGAMAATLLATLILPLQFAILVGVAISFLLHVLRSANRVEVRELVPVVGGFPVERPAPSSLETGSITVLRIRGSLFFASAQALEAQLPKASTALRAVVILTLRDIDDLGSTVIRLLKRYASDLERRGGRLVLAGVNDELRGQLERTGFAAQIGDDAIFEERPEIGMALNEAIAAARGRIEAASVQDGDRP